MKSILWAAVVLILGVILFVFWKATPEKMAGELGINDEGSITSLLATFVDKALDEDSGEYSLAFHCSQTHETCAPQHDPNKPPHMGYAIMSLMLVGEDEKNDRLVDKAHSLLDEAIEKCATIDSRYCEWNFFPLHLYYQRTQDEKYLDAMLKVAENVTSERSVRELVSYNLPVKWWRLYDATGDRNYLDQLTKTADEQLELYPEERTNDDLVYQTEGFEVRKYDLPMIWALYLPAYEASGDKKYLRPAIEFFRAAKLADNTEEFFDMTTTGDLVKGTEALITLAKADPENKDFYLQEIQNILEIVLEERWDTPENTMINGDYGILVSPTEKATNIQGWITYVILELERQFGVEIVLK